MMVRRLRISDETILPNECDTSGDRQGSNEFFGFQPGMINA